MSNELINMLRQATQELHQQLDIGFAAGQFADRTAYISFLQMHAQIVPDIEQQLAIRSEFQTLDHWQARLRSPALLHDLKCLSVAPPPIAPFVMPSAPGSVAGITYVMEGSRLGGRLIAKQLNEAGLGHLPASFVTHGTEQRYWQSYLSWLAERPTFATYQQNAIEAAKALFQHYINISAYQLSA